MKVLTFKQSTYNSLFVVFMCPGDLVFVLLNNTFKIQIHDSLKLFSFSYLSVLVWNPEKEAQASSSDLKQVLMGNVGFALRSSQVLCVDLMDTPTPPRWDFIFHLSVFKFCACLCLYRNFFSLKVCRLLFSQFFQLVFRIHNSLCFQP